jgi:regulatory protein
MNQPSPLTVRELRESPRRPGRYLLSLSDGQQLLVGIGALADVGVSRPGASVSPQQLARLQHEHAVTALADRALAALARGRRTRRELELRLRQREGAPEMIREALDRLEASGLLSDEAVAQAEAASRLRRGEAPARVRQQLRRKGVSAPLVAEALAEVVRDEGFDEAAACRVVAAKRARTLRSDDRVAAYRKLLGFLLRRGYSGTIARAVVREVLGTGSDE